MVFRGEEEVDMEFEDQAENVSEYSDIEENRMKSRVSHNEGVHKAVGGWVGEMEICGESWGEDGCRECRMSMNLMKM